MEVDMGPVYELLQRALHQTEEFRSCCKMSLESDQPETARVHLAVSLNSVRHSAVDLHLSLGFLIGVLANLHHGRQTTENDLPKQFGVNLTSVTSVSTMPVSDRYICTQTSKMSTATPDRYASAPTPAKTVSLQVTERYASGPTPTMPPPNSNHPHPLKPSSVVHVKELKEQRELDFNRISLPSFPSLCSSLSSTFPSSKAVSMSPMNGPASPSHQKPSTSNSPRQIQSSWSWASSSSSEHTPTRIGSAPSLLHMSPSWPPSTSATHSYTSSSLTQMRSPMTHSSHPPSSMVSPSFPSLPHVLTQAMSPTSMTSMTTSLSPSLSLADDDCQEMQLGEEKSGDCQVDMSRKRIFRKINSVNAGKKKKSEDNLICTTCGSTSTPQWRKGPDGKSSLCNACGIHYASQKKKILSRYRK